MAADTKRGEVLLDTGQDSGPFVRMRVDSLREQLAAQGLHVVTAADKVVLDVMATVPRSTLTMRLEYADDWPMSLARAELARRGLK